MKILFKIIDSKFVFPIIIAVFVIGMGVTVVVREGKDLKVGLYGVEQVLHKKSPYDNPLDPPRPLFRYAPGFTILQQPFVLMSEMTEPFKFRHITPSILTWYLVALFSLFASSKMLLKLIPASSFEASVRHLKLSILMALPLIGYELSNGQNKLLALFFIICAIFFFEKKKSFLSALFLNLAATVYIPLFCFFLYFLIRSRGRYLVSFLWGLLIVFFIVPSFVFGLDFNIYLIHEWVVRCIKPFSRAVSYEGYVDLRTSSQSWPSAMGRLFAYGSHMKFHYAFSPVLMHAIIRFVSFLFVALSSLVVWKRRQEKPQGLDYCLFLILALILPSYCIYYTWAWLFVIYFAILNYLSLMPARDLNKKRLSMAMIMVFAASVLISVRFLNYISLLFWTTACVWLVMVRIRWKKISQ